MKKRGRGSLARLSIGSKADSKTYSLRAVLPGRPRSRKPARFWHNASDKGGSPVLRGCGILPQWKWHNAMDGAEAPVLRVWWWAAAYCNWAVASAVRRLISSVRRSLICVSS